MEEGQQAAKHEKRAEEDEPCGRDDERRRRPGEEQRQVAGEGQQTWQDHPVVGGPFAAGDGCPQPSPPAAAAVSGAPAADAAPPAPPCTPSPAPATHLAHPALTRVRAGVRTHGIAHHQVRLRTHRALRMSSRRLFMLSVILQSFLLRVKSLQ